VEFYDKGITKAGTGRSFIIKRATKWKKLLSCHLYPIRVREYSELTARALTIINGKFCDSWHVPWGMNFKVPVYKFVKGGLDRKVWKKMGYAALEQIALEPY